MLLTRPQSAPLDTTIAAATKDDAIASFAALHGIKPADVAKVEVYAIDTHPDVVVDAVTVRAGLPKIAKA
jgi:hypothetical protein